MNTKNSNIEDLLEACEIELGIMITIHDLSGIFRDSEGELLLAPGRQSHRRNQLCFTKDRASCISHCMHKINSLSATTASEWFVNQCPFGQVEVIAPIKRSNLLVGVIFAGAWRTSNDVPMHYYRKPGLKEIFLKLPLIDSERTERIGRIIANAGRGLMSELENILQINQSPGSRKQEILRFIMLNANRKISTRDLAGALHLSVSRAGHLTEELFGTPFSRLVLNERIARAQTLLRSTDLNVGDIAQKTGFGNEYHFSRMFKKETGTSPGKYRKNFLCNHNP